MDLSCGTDGVDDRETIIEMIPVGGKKTAFTCAYCRRDITQSCRIKCAVCKDFELCTDCFGAGVNLGSHENTHAYRVSDCLDFPIFTLDWSAGEELLLFEGMEKCGVGNWKGCSEYIGTKTSKQVEDHYWETYMGVHGYCLPSTVISEEDKSTVISMEDYLNDISKKDPIRYEKFKSYYETTVNEGYTRGEEVIRDAIVTYGKSRGGSSSSSCKSGSADASASAVTAETSRREKDKQAEIKEKNALLPGGDLPGFLPLREDFDIEYDNDAEMLLADLEFNDDDHPTERELKHQVIQIFNRKLEERNRRKRFAIDRGLVDFKKHQQADRKRCKDEKELVSRLRMFARFQSPEDHEALVDGVLRARKLRLQIQAFQTYRKLGITTLEQARQYEIERRKRENDIKYKKQRENESYLFQTGRKVDTSASSSLSAFSFLNNQNDLSDKANNSTIVVGASTTATAAGGGTNQRRVLNRSQKQDNYNNSNNNMNNNTLSSSNHDNNNHSTTTSVDITNSGSTADAALLSRGNGRSGIIAGIMRQAPGAELLSAKEVELCDLLPLLPLHYLAIKEALIREAHRNGILTLEGVKRMIRLEDDKQVKIYDFFVRDTTASSSSSGSSNSSSNSSSSSSHTSNGMDISVGNGMSGNSVASLHGSEDSRNQTTDNANPSPLLTNEGESSAVVSAAVATKNPVGRKRKTPRV